MDVTVLYLDGCPNWQTAVERVSAALAVLGRSDVSVRHREATDADQAAGFVGSPTVLIDGYDPFGDGGNGGGASCRLYVTDAGVEGAPTVAQLIEVLGG